MARNLIDVRYVLRQRTYATDVLGILRIGLEAVGTLIFLRRLLNRGVNVDLHRPDEEALQF